MKKKSIIFLFALIAVLIVPFSALADDDFSDTSSDYTINHYNVDIVVNEDNTYDVTEKIGVYFASPHHGIYRKIPLSNTVVRQDGTKTVNHASVKNIDVDDVYALSVENGNRVIQIGSGDRTVDGQQEYTIKYTYGIGRDPSPDYDEFYYNIIGSEWETSIKNVSFTVKMPKEFEQKNVGMTWGTTENSRTDRLKYSVKGNLITGSFSGTLKSGEAISMRLELPDGYFVGAENTLNAGTVIAIAIPIVLLIAMFFIWRKFGKDDKPVETVEFYPPDNMNSAEVGLWYKGNSEKKDVVSLLVYLAGKGYLSIVENDGDSKDFIIQKLKDYDGNDENERIFFEDLFKESSKQTIFYSPNGKTEKLKNAVKLKDLEERFYLTIDTIVLNLNAKKKEIETKNLSYGALGVLFLAITYICALFSVTYDYFGTVMDAIVPTVIFGAFVTMGELLMFNRVKLGVRILGGIISAIAVGASQIVLADAFAYQPIMLIPFVVGVISAFFISLFLVLMPKRTKKGQEMLGRIRGFKNFLKVAEKEKLETLVEENPNYFFDILPYTYVLGVSDKWIKNFEGITIEPPQWYYSNGDMFDVFVFGHFMNSAMYSANHSMMVAPQPENNSDFGGGIGGGFSGGGFAGGGSGGGGGGAW